jgi:hypothetical protein
MRGPARLKNILRQALPEHNECLGFLPHLCSEVPLVVRIRLYNRGLCGGDSDAELRELPDLRQQKKK